MEKKKIGIVTITNDGYNYGNRLQNYALQTVLQRMGFVVETLNRPIRENQRLWWRRKKMVMHYFLPYHRKIEHLKAGNFFFWNKRYIKWSDVVVTDSVLPLVADKYDYFIAGSDQIWNPKFIWGKDPYMFLQFARPEQRIAYAPSIGLDSVDESFIPKYKEWWQDWKALSCRENSGAKIISELVGRSVPSLLDPTLLLTRQDWERMTKGIDTPKKYVFLYVLGELTEEYREYIGKMTTETGCELVDVMNDIRFAGCSPSKFVALIQHAEWVVADSYHAMAFAMVFHRPFTFLNRIGSGMNMSSRFQTLLDSFDIQVDHLDTITDIEVDWQSFEEKHTFHRKEAMEFLNNALL